MPRISLYNNKDIIAKLILRLRKNECFETNRLKRWRAEWDGEALELRKTIPELIAMRKRTRFDCLQGNSRRSFFVVGQLPAILCTQNSETAHPVVSWLERPNREKEKNRRSIEFELLWNIIGLSSVFVDESHESEIFDRIHWKFDLSWICNVRETNLYLCSITMGLRWCI